MAQVGSLTVDLIAQTAAFNSNITKAAQNLNGNAAKMNKSLQQIERAASFTSNGIKALAASLVVTEGLRIGGAALDYASSLGEVSQQLGITVRDLSVYRYAATQVGIEQSELETGIGKLTQTLGKAQLGSKASADVFSALGVSIRSTSGQFKTTSQIIPEIADAIAQIPDPARRASVEVQLFGRAGQKLDTLLSGGSAAISTMAQRAAELGIVFDDKLAAAADEAADKVSEVKLVLESNISIAVAKNAGAITELANSLGWLATKAGEAYQNYSNFRNLRGFNLASDPGAAKTLLSTKSGRDTLLADNQKKLDANIRARAAGDGDPAVLDKNFRDLNRIRNGVLRAGRAQDRIAAATAKPATAADLAKRQLGNLDGLLGGGGSGGKVKSASEDLTKEYKRQNEELKKSTLEWQRQLQIDALRNQGMNLSADLLQDQYDIEEKFPQRVKETNEEYAKRIAVALNAKQAISQQSAIADIGKNPMEISGDAKARIDNAWDSITNKAKDAGGAVKVAWKDAAEGVTDALSSISSAIQGGGFLEILSGAIGLLTSFGSIGLFGKSAAAAINTPRGFAGGGYTGNIAATQTAGIVHGKEFVFDAATTARLGVSNLERLRRGGMTGMRGVQGAINAGNDNARAIVVKVEANDYFDARVDRRADARVGAASPAIVSGASTGTQSAIQRKQSRRLA